MLAEEAAAILTSMRAVQVGRQEQKIFPVVVLMINKGTSKVTMNSKGMLVLELLMVVGVVSMLDPVSIVLTIIGQTIIVHMGVDAIIVTMIVGMGMGMVLTMEASIVVEVGILVAEM
jgi:hypothetical protein